MRILQEQKEKLVNPFVIEPLNDHFFSRLMAKGNMEDKNFFEPIIFESEYGRGTWGCEYVVKNVYLSICRRTLVRSRFHHFEAIMVRHDYNEGLDFSNIAIRPLAS
ncbi:hypothetical protein ACJX0J_017066, partial [Zea mays]